MSAEVSQFPTFSELRAKKLRLVTVRSQTSDVDIFVDTTTGRHFRSIEKPSKTKRRKIFGEKDFRLMDMRTRRPGNKFQARGGHLVNF